MSTMLVLMDQMGAPPTRRPPLVSQPGGKLDKARGQRIKALREKRGESQAEFGFLFDVEQATVSRWEAGYPVARTLWKHMAELAGTSAADFFLGTPLTVPLISWVSASSLADPGDIQPPDDAPMISATGLPTGDWFALRVEGDSMNRVAPEGCVIFVNRADRELRNRAFYVFDGPEGATFKRFADNPPRLEPFSTNPAHEIIFPQEGLRVVGRVGRVLLDL